MPVEGFHALVDSLKSLVNNPEKQEDYVAAALRDAMSANVVMRVLSRALMRARMWWPKHCFTMDPWEACTKSHDRAVSVDRLFASALKSKAGGRNGLKMQSISTRGFECWG